MDNRNEWDEDEGGLQSLLALQLLALSPGLTESVHVGKKNNGKMRAKIGFPPSRKLAR